MAGRCDVRCQGHRVGSKPSRGGNLVHDEFDPALRATKSVERCGKLGGEGLPVH